MSQQTIDDVRDYYGKVLKTNDDLKTSACCPLDAPPMRVQDLLKNIHEITIHTSQIAQRPRIKPQRL